MKRRKSTNRNLKKLYTALRDMAIQKAKRENNEFVLLQMTAIDVNNISMSDIEIMNDYLFDSVPHWFDIKTGEFSPRIS